jgi:hypothetical protein
MTRAVASGSYTIERKYSADDAHYEESFSFDLRDTDYDEPGSSDPVLAEPIDYEAALAERKRTHEPIEPVDTDLANTKFGI